MIDVNEIIEICKNTTFCVKCKCYEPKIGDCKYAALYPRDWIQDDEPDKVTEPQKPSKKKRGV